MTRSALTRAVREAIEDMIDREMTPEDIAIELERAFGFRPRRAWRLTQLWEPDEAVARFNALPDAEPMSTIRLLGIERWPFGGSVVSPRIVDALAELYGAPPHRLLDLHDWTGLPADKRTPRLHRHQLYDHWWWREGWEPGRASYAWYLTFDQNPQISALAEQYRNALAGLPDIDFVDDRHLHVEIQSLGFTDLLHDDDVEQIVAVARRSCDLLRPFRITVGPGHLELESISLSVEPTGFVRRLRETFRAATAYTLGASKVPEAEFPYTPRLTIAHANQDTHAMNHATALDGCDDTATATVVACQLVVRRRDADGGYRWFPYADFPLGGAR